MKKITIPYPDDWHCHLRDDDYLSRTVIDTAARFGRAIIMPNLKPPICNVAMAKAYRERIMKHLPKGCEFTPLMTLYLTEAMSPETIHAAKHSGFIYACKLYPAGATTHSDLGVKHLENIYPLLEAMQQTGLLLLVHGESIDPEIDIFDRERIFIDRQLNKLIKNFPNLSIVLEHISTKFAAEFVRESSSKLAATITPHHLYFNRNVIFKGGIHPHYYCLPILKRHEDQQALIQAAISGNPKFFLGTDSAPHPQSQKETACGCAGIYNAHAAIEMYAEIFEQHQALDKLAGFASHHGAEFYGLPINKKTLTLTKKSWKIPESLSYGNEKLIPMLSNSTMTWQIT